MTTQLSPPPPASSSATDVLGSSERRPATAQPPEPPPTTTKSNVSAMAHPPDRCYHALPVLVVARDEAKQSCCHRIEPLGLFGGRSRGFPLKSLVPRLGFCGAYGKRGLACPIWCGKSAVCLSSKLVQVASGPCPRRSASV